jgi:hypothetical protein
VNRELGEDGEAGRGQRDPDHRDVPDPDSLRELLRDSGADHDPSGHREEGQAGAQRAVAEDVLDVERREEEHSEHARGDEEKHEVGDGERPHPEDPEPHQRRLAPALDQHERRQQHDTRGHQAERPRRTPAPEL